MSVEFLVNSLIVVVMLLTPVVFVGDGQFAAAIRNHVLSRPRVLTWMRRVYAGAFGALGARLALADAEFRRDSNPTSSQRAAYPGSQPSRYAVGSRG